MQYSVEINNNSCREKKTQTTFFLPLYILRTPFNDPDQYM